MVHYTFAQQLERELAEAKFDLQFRRELYALQTKELAAAKDALLKAHKDYGCELRDPNGTIWEHAAQVQQQRDRLERELADLKESITSLSHPNCRDLLRERDEALRDRDNALSDWTQADTDSIRALHERNEAIEQRDRLVEALRELCETLLVKEPRDITDLLNKAGEALAAVKGGSNE
jgi:chromosome segregation ATPase